MKILILPSEQFIPAHEPLAGTFQNDQAKVLIKAGHKVSVISVQLKYSLPMIAKAIIFRFIGKRPANATKHLKFSELLSLGWQKIFYPEKFIKKEYLNDLEIYRAEGFYMKAPSPRSDYKYWIKAGMIAFDRYIKENGRPEIIHAHNALYAGLLAERIFESYQIPYMITEHSSYFSRNLYDSSLLPKAKSVFEKARIATAVSPFLIKCLEDIFPAVTKWQLLPNVADPAFEEKPLQKNSNTERFIFLHIANLIPLKQQSLLIEAFHEAFNTDENVQLEFAGEGESFSHLQQMINYLGEKGRIHLLGRLSKEAIFEKLNNVQVVCLPSEYETFGVSLLEAILRGVPVIASRCGGPDDIISEENGILFTVNDKNGLKQALHTIKNKYPQYNSESIKRAAIQKFGSASFLNKLENYYRQMYN